MLLSIPHQALEISNIHLSPFQSDKYGKYMARLTYKDNSIDFQDVSILSPPIKVIDYNPEKSRLKLDVSELHNFKVKLSILQEYIISTLTVHQQSFLGERNMKPDDIRNLFHFLLEEDVLSLYIFPSAVIKTNDGNMCKMANIKSGDTIRCVIRLLGISQLKVKYGIRLRLQHTIPSVWLLS
jgi:hypothetical protein